MAGCKGLHCDGCGSGGGLKALVAICVVVFLIGSGALATADGVIASVIATVGEVVKILLICLGAAAGALILGGTGWGIVRVRRWALARQQRQALGYYAQQVAAPQQQPIAAAYTARVLAPARPQWPHQPALAPRRVIAAVKTTDWRQS